MNKNIIVLIVGLIIVVGGGLYFLSQNSIKDQTMMVGETPTQAPSMVKDESSDKAMDAKRSASYIEYSKSEFEANKDKKRVLFFYANWCPICRPADKNIMENNAKIPEDIVVFRVNFKDSDTDTDESGLANTYKVTYQHTFIQIDENGNEIARWSGGQIDELLANIK